MKVSIPFKRESVSKAALTMPIVARSRFQFPSNGKVYPKLGFVLMIGCDHSFNSLQTGKCIQSKEEGSRTRFGFPEFQFPSNGKVYPKWDSLRNPDEGDVFQFPSNGKVYPKAASAMGTETCECHRFNSLQTGKCIQRLEGATEAFVRLVSIPFKRESVSKDKSKLSFIEHHC